MWRSAGNNSLCHASSLVLSHFPVQTIIYNYYIRVYLRIYTFTTVVVDISDIINKGRDNRRVAIDSCVLSLSSLLTLTVKMFWGLWYKTNYKLICITHSSALTFVYILYIYIYIRRNSINIVVIRIIIIIITNLY